MKNSKNNVADANNITSLSVIGSSDKPIKRNTGRGGTENFPNNKKDMIKTEEQRIVAKQLLNETLYAYRKEKVHNDDELVSRLDEYFKYCSTNSVIPTVEEMCLWTGYNIRTIWQWENGSVRGFSPRTSEIIKKAKDFLKTFDAKLVVSGQLNFLAYCFRAKNYYGMQDKQEVVVTPNNPLGQQLTAEEIQARFEELPED